MGRAAASRPEPPDTKAAAHDAGAPGPAQPPAASAPPLASACAHLSPFVDRCTHDVELLPSLGYFGFAPADALVLPLKAPVTGLRLELAAADGKALLTLHGAGLYKGGRRLDLKGIGQARQSSVYRDDPRHGPQSLLEGGGMHTKSDPVAWWTAEFDRPVDATEVRVTNLRDKWAQRAMALTVYVRDTEGQWLRIYGGRSGQQALLALGDILACCGGFAFQRQEPAQALRRRLLGALATALRQADQPLKTLNWRHLLSIVDLWGPAPLTDDELTVLAARLLPTHALDPLMSFTTKLPDRAAVLRLQTRMSEIAAARGEDACVLTRHGVQRSRLLARKDAYVEAIRDVLAALDAAGKSPMLCYGSLLGAVRDRGFIPHDDDVDLLYRCQATNRAEVEQEMTALAATLTAQGYLVRKVPPGLNMHVFDQKRGGLMIDIFPYWVEGGMAHLHMERMAIRTIDPEILHPPSTIELYGVTLPAPARPEALLLERYGADWNVSNQFFEWPWPLRETGASTSQTSTSA